MGKPGYKLNEIDEMDIHFYWDLFDEHQDSNLITNADDVPWL